MPGFPAAAIPTHSDSVYRSLQGPAMARIGAGFLRKPQVAGIEHRDYRPPTYSLVYVLRGSGVYTAADGRSAGLAPGSAFERRPDGPHTSAITPGSDWCECFIDLSAELYHGLATVPFFFGRQAVWNPGIRTAIPHRVGELVTALRDASESALAPILLRMLDLLHDLVAAGVGQDADDRLIEDACRLLADESATRTPLRAWCAAQGVGYERFRKLFARRMGMPPGRYRLRRRMDHACHLLQDTGLGIGAIADRLGYASPYEFSAQFRRQFGRPPSAYRRG